VFSTPLFNRSSRDGSCSTEPNRVWIISLYSTSTVQPALFPGVPARQAVSHHEQEQANPCEQADRRAGRDPARVKLLHKHAPAATVRPHEKVPLLGAPRDGLYCTVALILPTVRRPAVEVFVYTAPDLLSADQPEVGAGAGERLVRPGAFIRHRPEDVLALLSMCCRVGVQPTTAANPLLQLWYRSLTRLSGCCQNERDSGPGVIGGRCGKNGGW